MSKNLSHLFRGTKGERIAHLIQPSIQRGLVTAWAREKAEELSAVSKRQRDKFKTACIVVDEATGNFYYGHNAGINREGINEDGKGLHSTLEKILPSKSLNAFPTSWNCAESDAINKALHQGAKLENLHLYTIDTTIGKFGQDKESCINCKTAYAGRVKRINSDKKKEA